MAKYSKLMGTMPWQFRDKPHLEVLRQALASEIEQLQKALDDLTTKRSFDQAEGLQLDGVGDIVVLSRAEAGLLAAKGKRRITFPVLDDSRYRKLLRYKVLKNTSVSTYEDVVTAVKMIYEREPVKVEENRDGPATLRVSFPLTGTENLEQMDEMPPIKAAGVGIRIYGEEEREIHSRTGMRTGLIVEEQAFIAPQAKDDACRSRYYFGTGVIEACQHLIQPQTQERAEKAALYRRAGIWQEVRFAVGHMNES